MKNTRLWLGAIALLSGSTLWSQDLSGSWQATLSQGQQQLRLRLTIERSADGGWSGKLHSSGGRVPDWGSFLAIRPIVAQSGDVSFTVPRLHGTYQGKVSADGTSIQGTWTQAQAAALTFARSTPVTEWKDPAPHTVQFVAVDSNVRLEVLDFGGSGRPLVFLAGGGATGHIWDAFALKFTPAHHVYSITRRGSGDSSAPTCGYEADRMGDDVIAVLDALKLERPVLIGHSIAGEELSSVGSRHPERVAGLVYLDSAYSYAYYDAEHGDLDVDAMDFKDKLVQLEGEQSSVEELRLIQELIDAMPQLQKELKKLQADLRADPPSDPGPLPFNIPLMFAGFKKYNSIPVPILAIYAYPHDSGETDPKKQAVMDARDKIVTGRQADAFEKGVPSARVVRLAHAHHNIFWSNEADVIREMNTFLAGLK